MQFTNTAKFGKKVDDLISSGQQTGDDNKFGLVAVFAFGALLIMIVATKIRKND